MTPFLVPIKDQYGNYLGMETWDDHQRRVAAQAGETPKPTFEEENERLAAQADPATTGLLETVLGSVTEQYPGINSERAMLLARELLDSLQGERRRRMVRRLADEADSAQTMNLEAARAVTGLNFMRCPPVRPEACLGELVAEGHNASLVAQYKAGKTTVFENMADALVTGTPFLGVFDVARPYRVAWLNYELTESDAWARIEARRLPDDALERFLVVNLRGVNLSLTSPAGRKWLTAQLADHGTEVCLGDTYSAASAPSVDSENDNAAARRWLNAWDAIKAEAGVTTSIWSHHTGRAVHAEGEEHGRGATVLDDWCDVRMVLTRDRESGHRFLASEGRSPYSLPESKLLFDEHTRMLTLSESSIGENRARVRETAGAELVAQIVADSSGINTSGIRDALAAKGVTNNGAKTAAITSAKTHGLIHEHKDGHSQRHYLGAIHPIDKPCPEGWKP